MNDIPTNGPSSAPPPAPTGAVIPQDNPGSPQPLGPQTVQNDTPPQPPAQQQPPKPATVEETVRRVDQKLRDEATKADAKPADTKPAEKPAEKPAAQQPQHRENGKFAQDPSRAQQQAQGQPPQQQAQNTQTAFHEAPARFDAAAKAEWANAPESVRGAVHRVVREMEEGIQKYRSDAEAFNDIRDFHAMAQQHGTTLKAALSSYVGMENLLSRDLIGGLDKVVQNVAQRTGLRMPDGRPVTLQDVAARILGTTADESVARQNATIQSLQNQVVQLTQQLGGVAQTVQNQRIQEVEAHLVEFAKTHPRMEELTPAIERLFASGLASPGNLEEAYGLADRMFPAQQSGTMPLIPAQQAPLTPADQGQPLKPAGEKSISGAPSSGLPPTGKPQRKPGDPIPSVEESVARAFKKAARG